jgi:hypothetical protein
VGSPCQARLRVSLRRWCLLSERKRVRPNSFKSRLGPSRRKLRIDLNRPGKERKTIGIACGRGLVYSHCVSFEGAEGWGCGICERRVVCSYRRERFADLGSDFSCDLTQGVEDVFFAGGLHLFLSQDLSGWQSLARRPRTYWVPSGAIEPSRTAVLAVRSQTSGAMAGVRRPSGVGHLLQIRPEPNASCTGPSTSAPAGSVVCLQDWLAAGEGFYLAGFGGAVGGAVCAEDIVEPDRRLLERVGTVPRVPGEVGLGFAVDEAPVDDS